ncbi:MAG: hypothetical protein K2N12_07475 [Helicobacter sp.]|nr:hypothetical protein [Helicobacter sp.]
MNTFSVRMNMGWSGNRLSSMYSRQNAEQIQAVVSRDMGAHMKEGIGANNGGRAQLGLLVGVDISANIDPFSKKETETQFKNSTINLAIAQAERELKSEDTDEERGKWLNATMERLRELSEEMQKTLEQIAKEREKEKNPLAFADEPPTEQDMARAELQQLNETQRAEVKSAYGNAKMVASDNQDKIRQLLSQISRLQKEVLNDSVQITRVLSGAAPSVDFSVDTSAGGGSSAPGSEMAAIEVALESGGDAEAIAAGAPDVASASVEVEAAVSEAVGDVASETAGEGEATDSVAAQPASQPAESAPQQSTQATQESGSKPSKEQGEASAPKPTKTQGAKSIDMKTVNSLSMQRTAKLAKIMKLYEQISQLEKSSRDEASKVSAQSDSRNRSYVAKTKALKEAIYA